jgi:hypothetical protein
MNSKSMRQSNNDRHVITRVAPASLRNSAQMKRPSRTDYNVHMLWKRQNIYCRDIAHRAQHPHPGLFVF